jgi:WD40 repeat protein
LVNITRNDRQVVRISKEAATSIDAEARGAATQSSPFLKKSLLGHTQAVVNVAFSRDGRLLASSDLGGEVRVWDLPAGTLRYVLPSLGSITHAMTFSPDGKSLLAAAAYGNGDINVWDAQTGRPDGALKGHTGGLFDISFSSDGKTMVSAGWDAALRFWDLAARRELRAIPSPDGEWIRSAVISDRGAMAMASNTVFLFGTDEKLFKSFSADAGPLSLSANGRLLSSARVYEGRVVIWDVSTGEKVGDWRAHEGHVAGAVLWPNGRILATAGNEGAIRFWEVATQRQLAEVHHEGAADGLAFSPDGETLATTGTDDKLVRLWDVTFLQKLEAAESKQ